MTAGNANTRPIDRVLSHLKGVRRAGSGFVARCPHHDDRQASLSVSEKDDGKVLLHCFAGCANLDVLESAGLAWNDIFPPGSRQRLQTRYWKGLTAMGPHGRPALTSWGDDVSAAMLGELGRLAQVRGTLDSSVASAMRTVAQAVGVSSERLAESVRAALATDQPA